MKGDYSREIIISAEQGIFLWFFKKNFIYLTMIAKRDMQFILIMLVGTVLEIFVILLKFDI